MNHNPYIDPEVRTIIENWYGQSIEDMENEEYIVKHLVEPLSVLVERTYDEGFRNGERG